MKHLLLRGHARTMCGKLKSKVPASQRRSSPYGTSCVTCLTHLNTELSHIIDMRVNRLLRDGK